MGVWECSTGQWAKAICSAGKAWVRPVKLNSRYFSFSASLHLLLSILPPCQKSNSKQGQLYFESYSRHAWRDSLQLCYCGARPPSCSGGSDRSKQRTQFRKIFWISWKSEEIFIVKDRDKTGSGPDLVSYTHRQFSHGFRGQRTEVGMCNCFEVSIIRKTRGIPTSLRPAGSLH